MSDQRSLPEMSAAEDSSSSLAGQPVAEPSSAGQYMVVARRYRPQTFAELVGQQHVATALSGAIASQRVGHAYLFSGARGVGKTSAARILAKALNCVEGPTTQPCNRCELCESIRTGDDVDVLEIDGASNRGIDEIRELRQNVNVRPSRARFKIYIIDEVHMLTREAFNALLKTLEEPPEHVKFIFCTTEPEKIPITILSRCQRFDFAGIQTSSIAERLQQIVLSEGRSAEADALDILARRAAGSMRDGQSLLEQLLAVGGEQLTAVDVHRLLGTAQAERMGRLAGHLVDRQAAEALAELDRALAEGVDVAQLLDQLLGYFRDVMVAVVGAGAESLLHTSSKEWPQVSDIAGRLGLDTVLAVMQIIDQTLGRLRYSTHGRLLAELALVRICQLEDLEQLSSLIDQLRHSAASDLSGQATSRPQPAAHIAAKKNAEAAVAARTTGPSDRDGTAATQAALSDDTIQQVWRQVLAKMSDMTAENASHSEGVAVSAPNRLVVGFRRKYTTCKSFCERPEQAEKLQKALLAATGQRWQLEFVLLDDESPEERQSSAGPKSRVATQQERLFEKSQHPLVRKAMDLFDARPVKVEGPDG